MIDALNRRGLTTIAFMHSGSVEGVFRTSIIGMISLFSAMRLVSHMNVTRGQFRRSEAELTVGVYYCIYPFQELSAV